MEIRPKCFLPVEVVFHASWWHRHYGLQFDEGFFFDPAGEWRTSAGCG